MSKKVWVDSDHYRIVSDDGRSSELYESPGWFSPDRCVEVTDHNADGTTDAYEVAGFVEAFLNGGDLRGDHK